MPFLCPAPGITPMVFTALLGSHLGSPVQHWCPSVPNHPAQRNTGKTKLRKILDRAAGQENIPWPVWQGAVLECPSGFLLCQGFQLRVCACPHCGVSQLFMVCSSQSCLCLGSFPASPWVPWIRYSQEPWGEQWGCTWCLFH